MSSSILPQTNQLEILLHKYLTQFVKINWLESINSTNTHLLSQVRQDENFKTPALLGAHRQTEGKGRAGRQWVNDTLDVLMFSCAFDVRVDPANLPALAPALGIVATETLKEFLPVSAQNHLMMKWPNDVYFDEAKLAGILLEVSKFTEVKSEDQYRLVVGIGINLKGAIAVRQQLNRAVIDWLDILMQISPRQAQQLQVNTADYLAHFISRIATAWQQAIESYEVQGFEGYIERFDFIDALKNQEVVVIHQNTVLYKGLAQGLAPSGCLKVMTSKGLKEVIYGDVSVRSQKAWQ